MGERKRTILTNLASMQKEFEDGECYLIGADAIKAINYLRNEYAVGGVRKLSEIDIPLVYNKNGYFEEQLTGKKLKVSLPIQGVNNGFDGIMISNNKVLSCDSKIDVENYVPGLSDGLYLSSDKMVKIPSENAVLNFMNSVRNNDEAELVIGGILLSSYRSRKLLKKISETKEDTIKDFMAARENANTTFEIKTDELLEDSLEPIQVGNSFFDDYDIPQKAKPITSVQEHINFVDIPAPVIGKANDCYYLAYRNEENTLKNRFVRNLKAFKTTIKETFIKPVKLNKKLHTAKHVGNKKTYTLKRSNKMPKHAKYL